MSKYKGFNEVLLKKPQRSLFDLSHERCLTTRMGKLTPVLIEECLPGDTFKLNTKMLIRLAPMLAPVMHSFSATIHVFKVPIRLLWQDSELFFTGGRLGTETPPVPPNALISTIQGRSQKYLEKGRLADHLGLNPILDTDTVAYAGRTIDLLPHAAWYKVWYDYYRDRNYVPDFADEDPLPLPSGTTANTTWIDRLFAMRFRDWAPDYFTTALPWTQRGNQVLMPLAGTGSVTYLANSLVKDADGTPIAANSVISGLSTGNKVVTGAFPGGPFVDARIENIDTVSLTASSVSINDFRRAERLQEYLERNALAGSRYHEWTLAQFSVRGSDSRLQRAEYIGGRKIPINISEVVATAWSNDGTDEVPQGNMAGHSKTFGETENLRFFCEEHSFCIALLSVMPVAKYMQGSRRHFFGRNTNLDYAIPLLAHLGEQPVYKYELYSDPVSLPVDRTTQPIFGYQSRYSDWKNRESSCHGDFRDTMDFWTMTRKFVSMPNLSNAFCTFEDTLQDRIFAVSGTDTLWIYLYNELYVTRALPYFGTPML